MISFSALFFLTLAVTIQDDHDQNTWIMQSSGVTASLRGLSVVNENIVWASGTHGTVIRTVDGGCTWTKAFVREASELDFRDIHAFNSRQAVVLSAGQPARVYRTSDGGQSWKMCFQHPHQKSFFDALSFADSKYGIAMSDPVDDRVLLIETTDGGTTWAELPGGRRPKAIQGEAGFAASGTNMRIVGERILIALGGAEKQQQHDESRIVYSDDRAHTWQIARVPMPRNESSGIFSMHFVDPQHGVVVGGNYQKPNQTAGNIAITQDGGITWRPISGTPPSGYRSGVAHHKAQDRCALICVGTNGTDTSTDFGENWKKVSAEGFNAVAFTPDGKFGWATGTDGRIAKWNSSSRR